MSKCWICGREDAVLDEEPPGGTAQCPLCGRYRYTDTVAHASFARLQGDAHGIACLAAFVRTQNLLGVTPYFHETAGLDAVTVQEALQAFPTGLRDRICRTLRNLYSLQGSPTKEAVLEDAIDFPLCFAENSEDMRTFIGELLGRECIFDAGSSQERMRVRLALELWDQIEQSERGPEGEPPGSPTPGA